MIGCGVSTKVFVPEQIFGGVQQIFNFGNYESGSLVAYYQVCTPLQIRSVGIKTFVLITFFVCLPATPTRNQFGICRSRAPLSVLMLIGQIHPLHFKEIMATQSRFLDIYCGVSRSITRIYATYTMFPLALYLLLSYRDKF